MCLISQIITGLLVALHYSSHLDFAFARVVHICRDVNMGWLIRTLHANGASFFFICLYLHIRRGFYYRSYNLLETWISGVTIFFLAIATAFLGYVLPWGQMSFWGATVITNLLSTVPYVGPNAVQWLWGGFAVDAATLTRFFAFHFLVPFLILGLVFTHILFLHQTGSNNPLGTQNILKIPFHPYFTFKDLVGVVLFLFFLLIISFYAPYSLGDPENFNPANPLSTPPHIQPEWYYLFAYAILRSIPNKLGGVIALVLSIMVLYIVPILNKKNKQSLHFNAIGQVLIFLFIVIVFLLTWIGARPVEAPYILTGQVLTLLYFLFFLGNPVILQKI